ncbi:MAG TPA: CmcJ/NvfI family oxidoreductase, partial [Candidatus Limnocylindria bacterium]|nr:CmcJ/NvfI family oxidoreductase [Candidatus Limnocylindria bacterium]
MFESVVAEIPYTVPTDEKLINESFGPKNIHGRRTGSIELRAMTVRNGRRLAGSLSLDREGLVFVEHRTIVSDFFDEEQVKAIYYSEIEELIKRESGASRVVIFDHALRSGDEADQEARLIRKPVLQAHNDYTEWSGPNRLREILPVE